MRNFEGKWSLRKDDFLQEICFSFFLCCTSEIFTLTPFLKKSYVSSERILLVLKLKGKASLLFAFYSHFYITKDCCIEGWFHIYSE